MFFAYVLFYRLDATLLKWLNHHTMPHSIPFLQLVSLTATFVSIALVLGVLITALVKRSKALRRKFFILLTVLLASALVSYLLKTVVYRDRPFIVYQDVVKQSAGGDSSFPSGHSMEAFAIAMAWARLFRKKHSLIVFVWAGLIAYSRVALGVHFPSDVLAGIAIGCLLGWGIPGILQRFGFR